MTKKKKNISKTIKNGTAVIFKDKNLEFGRATKKPGHEIRLGHVIDSNKKNEVAIAKRQHSSDAISIQIEVLDPKNKKQIIEYKYNPNFKTKDKDGKPLKIDGKILIRANSKKDITPKQANEIKRQGLKEKSKNVRKPNKRRLKELKKRK